jgi:hypothetical protein
LQGPVAPAPANTVSGTPRAAAAAAATAAAAANPKTNDTSPMTQPQVLQQVTTLRPLPQRVAAMNNACGDVCGLSAGFSLGPIDGLPLDSLYDWQGDLQASMTRIEKLIAAREAAIDEARYAAMEQEDAEAGRIRNRTRRRDTRRTFEPECNKARMAKWDAIAVKI